MFDALLVLASYGIVAAVVLRERLPFRPCSFGARARGLLFCLLLFVAVASPFASHCFHL